jgi:hypothetical protein
MVTITEFLPIEKELIADLRFPADEVLTANNQITERRVDLERAMALGNLEHAKIKIYFEDYESCKVVETTVWGVTDKRVILKQGVGIPISRIHSVKI